MTKTILQSTVRPSKPSREDALEAVRTLLLWIGDDADREALIDTPQRVLKAYEELYAGYNTDPEAELRRTFEETEGYDEMVLLTNVEFVSHCEHHMMTIIGTANVAYLPGERVVGISKLARVVDAFAHRLQSQETMTTQIATAIDNALSPRGVAVAIEAEHTCMTTRGIRKKGVTTRTLHLTGAFKEDAAQRQEFLAAIKATR